MIRSAYPQCVAGHGFVQTLNGHGRHVGWTHRSLVERLSHLLALQCKDIRLEVTH